MIRLTIICHAPTEATRAARFPSDEEVAGPIDAHVRSIPPIRATHWLTAPERRAQTTAARLAESAAPAIDPDLRDWDVGRWTGCDLADLADRTPEEVALWMADPGAAPHGGESLLALIARAGTWLDRQARLRGSLAAITHPPVLRAVLVRALDAGWSTFWRIDIQPLSRAELSHDGRRWALRRLEPPSRQAGA